MSNNKKLQTKTVSRITPAYCFIFSIEYLALTTLIYIALVSAPIAAFTNHWITFGVSLVAILLCFRLIYEILARYFMTANKSKAYIEYMTVLTLIPPVIGPIVVLINSLDEAI